MATPINFLRLAYRSKRGGFLEEKRKGQGKDEAESPNYPEVIKI